MTELSRFLGAVCLAGMMGGGLACVHPKPKPPEPTPTPTPVPVPTPIPDPSVLPPKGQQARLDLLLRPAPGGKLMLRDGTPRDVFGAIQCCGGADGTILPAGANSRWPLASEEWMDVTAPYGANMFHFRLLFIGDADNETEWADIGGPYKAGTQDFNERYWEKVRELTWHAAKLNANVEVVGIDTWLCKWAKLGRYPMPMPAEDIAACGIRPSAEQERFLRKMVSEIGCLGNPIWLTDNEGGLIPGNKREWFEWVARVIRDEEQKTGCGVVHMIGTNAPEYGDGPFDYVATHERQPVTGPFQGSKWYYQNEHNPEFKPEQEAAYAKQAKDAGQAWALWLAGMKGDDVKRTFELFRDVFKGQSDVGCFPAPEDDPRWVGGPVKGCPDDLLKALAQAKAEVGDPRPAWQACVADKSKPEEERTPIACMFPTMDALASSMRRQGYCAGRTRDAVTAKANDGSTLWYEMHTNGATDGGYTASPCKGSTWRLAQ